MATDKPVPGDQNPDLPLPEKLAELLKKVTEKDLRGPQPTAETLKGNTNSPSAWIEGPAFVKFTAATSRRLIKVARLLGMADTKIARIHARFVGDSKTILIKPAHELDTTAFALSYFKGAAGGAVSLFDLLGPARATVETRYRQRYDVHLVPKTSALYPGLLIDLDDPKERKLLPLRKRKKKQTEKKPSE